jgi:hypothetical protein
MDGRKDRKGYKEGKFHAIILFRNESKLKYYQL